MVGKHPFPPLIMVKFENCKPFDSGSFVVLNLPVEVQMI